MTLRNVQAGEQERVCVGGLSEAVLVTDGDSECVAVRLCVDSVGLPDGEHETERDGEGLKVCVQRMEGLRDAE